MRLRAILILVLASLFWGSGWIVSPLLAQGASPFAASALVFGCGCLSLLPAAFFLRRGPGPAVPLGASALLGLLLLALPTLLLTVAGEHGIAGWTPLLYATLPLLLSVGDEGWSPVLILPVGCVLVLLNGTVPFSAGKLPWVAAAFLAVAAEALALPFAARVLRGRSPEQIAVSLAVQLALAAAVLALASAGFDPHPRIAPRGQWSGLELASLGLLGILGTAVAYLLLLWLLARGALKPAQIATTQWLQTLVTVVESAAFAHSLPSWPWLVALAVLTGCVVSVLRRGGAAGEAITLRGSGVY